MNEEADHSLSEISEKTRNQSTLEEPTFIVQITPYTILQESQRPKVSYVKSVKKRTASGVPQI